MVNREPEQSSVRFFRVDRRDLVYLKFILEAYEGMATMSTVDIKAGVVRISCGNWAAGDIASLIESLAHEISIVETDQAKERVDA
jgi:hypothetical protein